MQKRRSKKISILIVPEDNAEPYSFRLKTRVVKGLYVLAAILIVHIILGGIAYWKYAKLSSYNKKLIAYNTQLQEDNKKVIALADQFYALEKEYTKVKSLLGVEDELTPESSRGIEKRQSNVLFDSIVPAISSKKTPELNLNDTKTRYLLSPKESKYHDYVENIPTLLPVKGFLTLDFQREGWFMPKTHTGVDIVAKKGTIIRAAGAGVIIFANWTFDLGNLIIIDHGGGILSYYAHAQRILQPEKSYVKKGQPIALLGSSGKSTGPHLHFEIWKDGAPVDPKEYILAFHENNTTN
ncbi:MAG: M23 family metallopeptidase [bacterium]